MLDIDKLPLPPAYDLIEEPQACVEYAVSQLPEEFHKASYIWHLWASSGLKFTDKISVHLFFWLSKSWANESLRRWAKSINAQHGRTLIDPAPFNAVQPHFIADPECVGFEDPLKGGRLLMQIKGQ
ncbi:hypothetical protein EYZ66_08970 [Aequoribacter fuscus]|nr:hypothetical protein EYZ66_08970 [Aequoribacter fuscus]